MLNIYKKNMDMQYGFSYLGVQKKNILPIKITCFHYYGNFSGSQRLGSLHSHTNVLITLRSDTKDDVFYPLLI